MSAAFLKHLKKDPSVKRLLHRSLARMEMPRSPKITHASDLTKEDYCPRQVALRILNGTKGTPALLGTSMATTFATGRMIEHALRNDWLVDHVVGFWKCSQCGDRSKFGRRPMAGGSCGDNGCRWEYDEPRFKDPDSGVSCGVDFLLAQDVGKHLVVESKIMDKDMFRDLKMPLAEHRIRTMMYLSVIEKSEHPVSSRIDTSRAVILYMSRSFGFKDDEVNGYGVKDTAFSPFKEYIVKRNDELVEPLLEQGRKMEQFKQQGIAPPGICSSPKDPVAIKCDVCKLCFSGKYPAGQVVPEFEES